MNIRLIHHATMLFCSAILATAVLAGPQQLNYQGQLYKSGVPVEGTQVFSFAINAGGVPLWQSGNQVTSVVEAGFFSVALGDPAIMNPLPASIFESGSNLFLRVSVGPLGGSLTTLTPDKGVLNSPYAISADSVNGVDVSQNLGVTLNAQLRPLITRAWQPFISGNYAGAGRWGMFLEFGWLVLGVPGGFPNSGVSIATYNSNSTVSNTLFCVREDGHAGVGTNAPEAGWDVRGPGWPLSFMYLGATAGGGSFDSGFRLYVTNVPMWHIYNMNTNSQAPSDGNALTVLRSDWSPAVKLTQDGRVGIGTQDPNSLFTVDIAGRPAASRIGIKGCTPNDLAGVRLTSSNDVFWGIYNEGPLYGHEYILAYGKGIFISSFCMSVYTNGTMKVGNHNVGETADATVHIVGPGSSSLKIQNAYTPSGSADAAGTTGTISWDANYIYVKTASGWKRAALSTF